MTDKIRQAAVDCAKEVAEAELRYFTMEFKELSRADIIERAMRKLVPSEPNPYAVAMEKHLCEHDMADWLACAGHGDNFCAACNNEKEHSHNSQPEASASVRLDGETHCVDAQPAEYGRSRSMDKRLTAQGKSQPAPSESPAASRHVPTLTFGAGEFSCAVCGLGMEKPCEHWKQMELVKALKGFTTDDGTWMQGATSEILFAIRAYVAERVREAVEAEREACAKIADEDFTLDEHTPCDEGHREFYKKYGTAEVCEAIRARGAEAKR